MLAWFSALSIGRKLLVGVGSLVAIVLAFTLLVKAVSSRDERLKQAGRDEVQSSWNAEKAGRQQAKAEFQTALTAALSPQFDQLASRIGAINTKGADINVRLPQAIAAAPRYTDPNCNLTAPVLDQVNAARALSQEAPK